MVKRSLISSKEQIKIGEHFIDVRRSVRKPTGPVVLLLHGIGVSGTYYLPFAEILANIYDVRILDMPGYGKTPRPDHPLSPAELADVAANYLVQSGVSSVIVIGQSMGCQTATRLAERYPALCQKLILVSPTVNRWERNIVVQAVRLLQDGFHEPLKVNQIIVSDYFRMGVVRYLKTAKYMLDDHIENYASSVRIPVLIVRGTKDKIVPPRWTSYLAGRMKRVTVKEIVDAPHVVQFVRPQELFTVCEDFLTK